MTKLAEQCRDVRSHGNAGLGRASIQPAVCTGIHEVNSSIPSVRPRRVAVLRLSNGMTTTLRLGEGATAPERGATVFVQGGRGMGDQPASGGVILASSDPKRALMG
jgi:ribosomal protein S12